KGELDRRTKFMFVVTRMPFDGGMCSRHPTTAHGTDSGILGKNFRQRICELAAHSSNSNILFGAHGSPPTLTGPAIWPNRHCSDGFQGRSRLFWLQPKPSRPSLP